MDHHSFSKAHSSLAEAQQRLPVKSRPPHCDQVAPQPALVGAPVGRREGGEEFCGGTAFGGVHIDQLSFCRTHVSPT